MKVNNQDIEFKICTVLAIAMIIASIVCYHIFNIQHYGND